MPVLDCVSLLCCTCVSAFFHELQCMVEVVQQDLNFKCSSKDCVAVDGKMLGLNEDLRTCVMGALE